jgi:hypothetical protein
VSSVESLVHRATALLVALAALSCAGRTRVGLMPPIDPNAARRDPTPTRSSVDSVEPPERDAAAGDTGVLLPESVQVSLAALAVWILTGTLFGGIYGSFDENRLFGAPAPSDQQPPRRPAGGWRSRPGCPAFLCGPDLPRSSPAP